MSNIRIATPTTGRALKEFLENLEKVQNVSDFIEIRADSIEDLEADHIKQIYSACRKETILTISNRTISQGGWYNGSEDYRIDLLKYAASLGFAYIDIEMDVYGQHDFVFAPNTELILSKHYFEETPNEQVLTNDIKKATVFNPAVIKIAMQVKNNEDLETIFRLIVNRKEDEPQRIMIGMGEMGRISRVIGPILGCPWTYSRTPANTLFPGHIEFEEMKEIYNRLQL